MESDAKGQGVNRARRRKAMNVLLVGVDDQFLKTFEVSLLKGRNFSSNPGDSSAVIINETAANMLGIKEPSEQMIEIPSIDFNGNVETMISHSGQELPVFKDFNFRSLREKVAPMIMAYKDNLLMRLIISRQA